MRASSKNILVLVVNISEIFSRLYYALPKPSEYNMSGHWNHRRC